MFETAADNVGFMSAVTEYVIELQSDMRMLEQGWDTRLLAPMRQVSWLFAISGRACHSWSWLGPISRASTARELRQKVRGRLTGTYATKRLDVESFVTSDAFGALDHAGIESVTQLQHLHRNEVFLSDSVNRGPLAIRSSTLRALGFLDEAAYLLGGDEHDLMLRAHSGAGLRCGYVPLLVQSPRAHSATAQTPAPSTIVRRQTLESVKTRLRTTSALGRYLQETRAGRRQMAPAREVLYLDDVVRGRN